MPPNISSVTNKKAQAFLKVFLTNRNINRQFYQLVPENKFDFRMVDTPQRKSDSPRESLAHQIAVELTYLQAAQTGQLDFSTYDDAQLKTQSKSRLLKQLDQADRQLIKFLTSQSHCLRKIKVPWAKSSINVIDMLRSLDSHETLHTGWNLAIMDHLNLPRFPALKKLWG